MAEEEARDLGPLPAGRHRYSREQVAHNQRERLIAAVAKVVDERGYNEITIADITAAARVSRRTFYENFESKEQCFLAAFDALVEHTRGLVAEAVAEAPDWPHSVPAALRAGLRFLAAEPELARLCMVDSLTAGPAVTARYCEVALNCAWLLAPGREQGHFARPLPQTIEDTVIGAVALAVSRAILTGDADRLEALVPDFTAFMLMPFLGPEAAHRVAVEAAAATPPSL